MPVNFPATSSALPHGCALACAALSNGKRSSAKKRPRMPPMASCSMRRKSGQSAGMSCAS